MGMMAQNDHKVKMYEVNRLQTPSDGKPHLSPYLWWAKNTVDVKEETTANHIPINIQENKLSLYWCLVDWKCPPKKPHTSSSSLTSPNFIHPKESQTYTNWSPLRQRKHGFIRQVNFSTTGHKKVTFKYRWLLNRGDLMGRIDCICVHFLTDLWSNDLSYMYNTNNV
jgi:hypothetical protein